MISTILIFLVAALAGLAAGAGWARRRAREERFGSYCLGARLGVGGMGEVFAARHRWLERDVALKVVRPEHARGRRAQTLFREAQALRRVRGRHVQQLLDVGLSNRGRVFVVMERFDGETLEDLVHRLGPQTPRRVASILAELCAAVSAVHAAGLVHGDIKPANVLVGRSVDEPLELKLIDFGLARDRGPVDSDGTSSVEPSGGTPGYVAPEVAGGGRPNRRSDIFGVAMVACWMLTGRPGRELDGMVEPWEHLFEPLPRRLGQVLRAAGSHDPRHRARNAEHLAALLRGCLDDDSEGWDEPPHVASKALPPVGSATDEATLADTVPPSMTLPEMGLLAQSSESDSVPLPLVSAHS